MMAVDNARQFLDTLCNDASIRAQFNSTGAANINTIMDFGMSKGFVFSEKDLREALQEYPEHYVVDQMRERLKVQRTRPAAQTT
jgi:hypothetical protein